MRKPSSAGDDISPGSCLGLSASYYIVTETHRGTMSLEETEGKGTRIVIGLPVKPR